MRLVGRVEVGEMSGEHARGCEGNGTRRRWRRLLTGEIMFDSPPALKTRRIGHVTCEVLPRAPGTPGYQDPDGWTDSP